MKSLNQVTVQGNLSKKPEIIENEHGKVTYFDIACNNTFKKDDEKIDNTVWVQIRAKGKQAEYLNKYFDKGSRVIITGSLYNSTREIDGKNYTFTGVSLSEIINLTPKSN